MSSRPTTNLARILASINFKEDEAVLTPEPLTGNGQKPVFNFNQIPASNTEETDSDGSHKDDEKFFTASEGTSFSSSSEDVPLTPELLTSGVQVQTASGLRNIWNGQHEARRKRLVKRFQRSSSARVPVKKESLRLSLPSTSVFHYDSTSDGLDVYQERKGNKKRKMKKRSNGNEEKGKGGKETKN